MACSVSRGIELVAIRMSHTSGVSCAVSRPSTLVQWGVISVMPWMTFERALVGHHREHAAAVLVERRDLDDRPDAIDACRPPGHALMDGDFLGNVAGVELRRRLGSDNVGMKTRRRSSSTSVIVAGSPWALFERIVGQAGVLPTRPCRRRPSLRMTVEPRARRRPTGTHASHAATNDHRQLGRSAHEVLPGKRALLGRRDIAGQRSQRPLRAAEEFRNDP